MGAEERPPLSLGDFWREDTERLITMCEPKVIEYGSEDLVELGRDVARMAGRPVPDDGLAYELGVFFYVRGKMARWMNAAVRGEHVNQDSLDDILTYVVLCKYDRKRRDT